jgi:flagellar L-ring protein precursor FlgH
MKWTNIISAVLLTVGGTWMVPDIAGSDSLYPAEGAGSIYTEKRARRVGDVITIFIQEVNEATQAASSRNQKDANISLGAGIGFWGGSPNIPVQQAGAGARTYNRGQGTSSRSAKVIGQMTAKITAILPSGNYVVEGTRYVEVNDDKQLMEVTGEIRPDDISSENTVISSRVANARIKITGTGPASETAKPGFLTRILSWLWIF